VLRPREAVRMLPSYHPPLAGREGLRLDFNENTVGCSPRVLEKLQRMTADDLTKYPERQAVESTVAGFLKVSATETLLTNGVDEAIHLLCQTYLSSGDEALIVAPTYSMYRIYAMAAGANVINVPLAENFRFPLNELKEQITPRTRLIAIANPNNPTGTVATREQLLQLAHAAPEAAVLVDEAYFEFYGQTMLNWRNESANLFVARTFSKAYGMAGLRVGMLIGDAEQMHAVRLACSPYNVNAVALACVPCAIQDQSYLAEYVEGVLEARARLQNMLAASGIKFWSSEANFVLLRVGSSKADSARFVEQMRRRGILVRDRSSDHGCEGCVRITLGPGEHADRLLEALPPAIEECGIAHGVSRR
jgi:histidinol-phosphate aminotransferase